MNVLEVLRQTKQTNAIQTLGIEIVSADKDQVVLTMPVEPKVHQYTGILHGGISVVLAETAASIGAAMNVDISKQTPVGVEINANHLRSVSSGTITATATPVYHGRTLSVWNIEIKDDRNRLVCVSRCTLALKAGNATAATENQNS